MRRAPPVTRAARLPELVTAFAMRELTSRPGIKAHIVSGQDEARYSGYGVMCGMSPRLVLPSDRDEQHRCGYPDETEVNPDPICVSILGKAEDLDHHPQAGPQS